MKKKTQERGNMANGTRHMTQSTGHKTQIKKKQFVLPVEGIQAAILEPHDQGGVTTLHRRTER